MLFSANNKEEDLTNEILDIECICENTSYKPKNKLIKCFLCNTYQHLSCINQAKFIRPYICFNCQFKNNHFYLKWKKTILPAKEIIYLNKWVKDKSLLEQGTKEFKFFLNLNDFYSSTPEKSYKNGKSEKNSYYLAFLWMTNNGKPFNFGFPDNISIKINNIEFYSTDSKEFKYPLLLALDNSNDYIPKKKQLITKDNIEIASAEDYFYTPKNPKSKGFYQTVTVKFENFLENYYGSEFEFEETRRYLFYIGIFQEIKIPSIPLLKSCSSLSQYNEIFKNYYREKVLKMKWSKISHNIVPLDSEKMNMNLISNVSNQKIIHPIRGLFCQHSDVLDFGECCRYITSKNQIYKCYKCHKPLNIMYIDDASEKLFNEYKDKGFSEIYFNNKFKLIKGETKKCDEVENDNGKETIELDDTSEENESLNDSFFNFYKKQFNLDKGGKNKIYNNLSGQKNDIIINIEKGNNENFSIEDDNVIELSETISLSSDSDSEELYDDDFDINIIDMPNKDNKVDKNVEGKNEDLKNLEGKFNKNKNDSKKEKELNISKFFIQDKNLDNHLLNKKRKNSKISIPGIKNRNNENNIHNITPKYPKNLYLYDKIDKRKSRKMNKKGQKNKNEIYNKEEIIEIRDDDSDYDMFEDEIKNNNSIQYYSTNSNEDKFIYCSYNSKH